jgi:hypothetical protein
MDAAGAWPVRVAWAALPFTVGPALDGALGATSRSLQLVVSIGAWLVWAGVLGCVLVPRAVTLTAVRVVAPGTVAVAGWSALRGDVSPADVVGLSWTLAVVVVAFLPATGEVFVDGSSYGDERRLPLRVPFPLLAGPLPLAWLLVAAGVAAGPLLLAGEQWLPGAAALVVGVPLGVASVRRLHQLSRRWAVLVPAGLVLHDPMTLADPQLFPRRLVERLGPAPGDTDAVDLTQRALGLALQLDLVEPVKIVLVHPRADTETVTNDRLLFTPTRPGRLLTIAAERRMAVG